MLVTAYKIGQHQMKLLPASRTREWMDNTPNQYAYRCLPLQIANANGWVLECPEDVIIHWDGGAHKSALSIHYARATWDFAASSFGVGIVTFHSGYLFRTPDDPAIDMLVGGLPNFWYDFMTPLTGIVETWWNPATFTMNWKLLRPGSFTIKAGDPLAFLMPIPHARDGMKTKLVDLQTNPQELHDFNEWSEKRNRTINALDHMERTGQGINGVDPANPGTHWEKDYFQGNKDNEKIKDHRTKIKFPPFE